MAHGFSKSQKPAPAPPAVHVHIGPELVAQLQPVPSAARPQFRASLHPDGTLELMVYGDIVDAYTISMLEAWGYSTDGLVSAVGIKKALDDAGSAYNKILVRINSPGGDAFEGIAIHALLTSQPKPVDVCVDGLAASSASIVAMAGATRRMGQSAMMMIHRAWTGCVGNSQDMRKMGDTLDKIDESIAAAYVQRTGMKPEQVMSLMNEETWLTAQDCVDQGFATALIAPPAEESAAALAMARGFKTLAKLKHVPATLRGETAAVESNDNGCECACDNCQADDCQNCTNQDCMDSECKDCPMQQESGNQTEIVVEASNLSLFQARQWLREKGIA